MLDDDPRPLAGRTLLLLPRYSDLGPSSRLRMSQFIPALQEAGARVRVEPLSNDAYLTRYFATGERSKRQTLSGLARRVRVLLSARADLVWVEKEAFPYMPAAAELLLRRGRGGYVVDYDDAAFHVYDRHRISLVRRLLGRRLVPLIHGSALVLAGNKYLADYARRHGARDIAIIPTVIDPARYPVTPPDLAEPFRIGWIGTPGNACYLELVVEAANALSRERAVEFVTVGSAAVPGLSMKQLNHPWSEAREAELLGSIDVGVMPLFDSPFERGKCGYKLIQYMAAGRPVVASPIGVNSEIVAGDVGFLASTPAEWLDAFRRLADSPELRVRMGAAARARVERLYSVAAVAPVIVGRFAEICARADAQ